MLVAGTRLKQLGRRSQPQHVAARPLSSLGSPHHWCDGRRRGRERGAHRRDRMVGSRDTAVEGWGGRERWLWPLPGSRRRVRSQGL